MTIKLTNELITASDNEGWEYDGIVNATFSYTNDPGSMYRRNGDPGDPPFEELECISFKLTDVTKVNEDGEEYSVDITDDIEQMFYDAVEEYILENIEDYVEDDFEGEYDGI